MNLMHEKIIQLYKDGMNYEEIAEATGYKKTSVKTILSKKGITKTPSVEYKVKKMIELFNEGYSNNEIAEIVGCHFSTVSTQLSLRGYTRYIRHSNEARRHHEPIDESKLQYAERRKPKFEKVTINGKQYIDVTDMYM